MVMEVMEMVCTCSRDPHRHAHSVKGCLLHDPALLAPRSVPVEKAEIINVELLQRIRACMNRWASRYAEAEHAKKHVKETRLLIQEIDEILLRQ